MYEFCTTDPILTLLCVVEGQTPLLPNVECYVCTAGCCAVARAQHLGQNSRFAQQAPRAAQPAILGARHFSPQAQAKKHVARLFFAVRREIVLEPFFSNSPGGDFYF